MSIMFYWFYVMVSYGFPLHCKVKNIIITDPSIAFRALFNSLIRPMTPL